MYLYKSWDDRVYLSEYIDGAEGLLINISGNTTIEELTKYLTVRESIAVFKGYLGQKSFIEVFT
jgi:hypothetical protein